MHKIGEISKSTGIKIPTIRYYENIGLLPSPGRNRGNQRRYSAQELSQLHFIAHARDLGMSLKDIKTLLQLRAPAPHFAAGALEEAHQIARNHLADIRRKSARLADLQRELERISDLCSGDHSEGCRLMAAFDDRDEYQGADQGPDQGPDQA